MSLLLFPRVATFLVVVVVAGAIWSAWTRKRSRKPVLIPIERFDSLWALWTRTHGMPKGVIVRQPPVPAASAPARKEGRRGRLFIRPRRDLRSRADGGSAAREQFPFRA
jgi:hypothetical protein